MSPSTIPPKYHHFSNTAKPAQAKPVEFSHPGLRAKDRYLLKTIFLALAILVFGGLITSCLSEAFNHRPGAGDASAQVDGNSKDADAGPPKPEAGADAGPDRNPVAEASADRGSDKTQHDGPRPEAGTDGPKGADAKADGTPDKSLPSEGGPNPEAGTDLSIGDTGLPWKTYTPTADTNFKLGTTSANITGETYPDGLTLKQTWSGGCYYASSKALPSSPFSLQNNSGTTVTPQLLQDSQGRWFLRLDSQTANLDKELRYRWTETGLTAATGSAHLLVARLHNNDDPISKGLDSSLEVFNDKWSFNLGLGRTQVCENTQSPVSCNTLSGSNPMTGAHTYRANLSGSTYSVSVDGSSTALLAGISKMSNYGLYGVHFGDNAGKNDAALDIYVFCVHQSGTDVPVTGPGTYSRIYNLGTASNNIGQANGAKIIYQSTTPSGATVVVKTRTGSTPTPDTSWTSSVLLGPGGAIQSPANQYLEVSLELSTANFNIPILWAYSLADAKIK
ncbi:hypothetical protein A2291_04965 [candidate division WOR-1 bacterium RIFOXYB2_FULL_42_35]|uniref:Uncharacterized protein n=1 Tax=candidate division WOR-1 bacterium RIFOXYC2_FULL_41_25 TaxID=1802586 RepID=A0A1F4TN98_UNCSA|nr:MAG: hypothetical protein A2247_07165 [candidate division WOR-1 bacterium RIFOXYA2_FULL_41_14]OGC24680.1 MAG: hypothetical protein A2291_04965 [candidate division WOR-1 bacterium RIFOXYB2_FULL_42_35]OGC34195.1 MAG: hypothetical protein A2462_08210 [candidate division WOR-1 bacterium RIFOXYC2_FULL_41_25]OGC41399.1 MAG: hypothetical protein A2548_00980 [candidate division WOR-1 bacterium RIFOXYD2_FULL_41_8]